MKKLFLMASILLANVTYAETASQARIGELTSHRIERLVNLKKIDGSFISKLRTIEVQKLPTGNAGDPTFLSVVSQFAGSDGTKNQVEIYFDDQGKALSFKLKAGALAQDSTVWPDKDPSTLVENSLHFVLDHVAEKTELKPFYDGLNYLELRKVHLNGADLAQVEVHSIATQQFLIINLKPDGTFLSYEIR